jgi:soluble lytic murein transglycosylase-like protein
MKLLSLSIIGITLLAGNSAQANNNKVFRAITAAAVANNIPPNMLRSICYVESKYDPKAFNKSDGGSPSYGLCQIKLRTAQYLGFRGSPDALFSASVNARYAARYLNYQYRRYGDWYRAIAAYNMGHARRMVTNRRYVNLVVTEMLRGPYSHSRSIASN